MTAVKFAYIIRKKVQLQKDQALFLFVNGKDALKGDTPLLQVYESKKDADGFLYVAYSTENVLG